jgi:hypothetical protein
VLALVALLTGAFLVFATQLTAVAQRSTQFALLGVLGLPPRMRLLQVLIEGLAIGVPGSALGLLLGFGLAVAFTGVVGGDLGGGFFSSAAPVILPQALPAAGFFALGCLASLLGALYPAWLNRIQPLAQALKTGFAQRQTARSARVPVAATHRDRGARRRRPGADPRAGHRRPAPGRLCRHRAGAGPRHRLRAVGHPCPVRHGGAGPASGARKKSRCRTSSRRR